MCGGEVGEPAAPGKVDSMPYAKAVIIWKRIESPNARHKIFNAGTGK